MRHVQYIPATMYLNAYVPRCVRTFDRSSIAYTVIPVIEAVWSSSRSCLYTLLGTAFGIQQPNYVHTRARAQGRIECYCAADDGGKKAAVGRPAKNVGSDYFLFP